jgi:hypothetical protein
MASKKSINVVVPIEAVADNKFHNLYLVVRPNGKEENPVKLQAIRFLPGN